MGILDAPLRNVASTLATKFGQEVTITFRTTGSYNATTGTAAKTDATQTVRAIVEPYKARFQAGETEGGARANDLQLTIAAQGLTREPNVGDKVSVGGQEHEVVEVDPTYSGDQVAIYTVHVRR